MSKGGMQSEAVNQYYCDVCGKTWSLKLPIKAPIFTHFTRAGNALYCNVADGTKRSRLKPHLIK